MYTSVIDHPFVISRYFFPRREVVDQPFIMESNRVKLACYYKKIASASNTIVFFHGNGETVSDFTNTLAFDLCRFNCNILLAEYRGFGMSEGKPSFTGIRSDVKTIIDSVNQSYENTIVFGRSLGSLFALHAVSLFPEIGGLILESGIADLYERIESRMVPETFGISAKELKEEVLRYFNQQQKQTEYKGSTLILHTKNDRIVDYSNALKLYYWANKPKTLKIFERGDHNTIYTVNQKEYVQTIGDFIRH